ncbi:hypothetical protein BV25DRAFT_1884432 [Artomyces pyxidatus]|uniref:Uncharacterized protein n=1 Tax=Artomyces pyxidatus TaxID=48021 RepID=A0ACB8T425_9AGAM|nr:hypothetical protein BV25DRAFT_1884432 [Artomyces pyxidatus]
MSFARLTRGCRRCAMRVSKFVLVSGLFNMIRFCAARVQRWRAQLHVSVFQFRRVARWNMFLTFAGPRWTTLLISEGSTDLLSPLPRRVMAGKFAVCGSGKVFCVFAEWFRSVRGGVLSGGSKAAGSSS